MELKENNYSKEEKIKKYCLYHINEIADGKNVRLNLRILSEIYFNYEDKEIYDYCLLYWAWDDLDYQEYQDYWPKANKNNILELTIEYANKWIKDL